MLEKWREVRRGGISSCYSTISINGNITLAIMVTIVLAVLLFLMIHYLDTTRAACTNGDIMKEAEPSTLYIIGTVNTRSCDIYWYCVLRE
jgi:capsular polysaccharide biosynthesis protein